MDEHLTWQQQFERRIMERFEELAQAIRKVREDQRQANQRLTRIETTLVAQEAAQEAVQEDRRARVKRWHWWLGWFVGAMGAVYGAVNLARAVIGH